MEIRILARQGHSIREIARELGVSRNTVRKYLREPQLPRYRSRSARASKLDAFKGYLAERLAQAAPHRLPATVLLREIRAQGYTGGASLLRQYLRTLRPAPVPEPLVRFETAPGVQLQIDWGEFRRSPRNRLCAFVATLGYSRASFVRFVDNARAETLVDCLQAAFDYFGGVPREVLCDNAKSVVLERDGYGPGQHRFHAALWDYAHHAGFTPRLCKPYRAKTKGKVERFIRYVRESFYWPLVSQLKPHGLVLDVASANIEVLRWLNTVANTRVHATTQAVPFERLREEHPQLQALPPPYRVQREKTDTPQRAWPSVPPQHAPLAYDRLLEVRA